MAVVDMIYFIIIWAVTAIASYTMLYYHRKLMQEVFKISIPRNDAIVDYVGCCVCAPIVMWMLAYITYLDYELRRNWVDNNSRLV
jgi:hypothetical protein